MDVMEDAMTVPATSEPQDLESTTEKIRRRISSEPACRAALYKLLVFCESARSNVDVEQKVLSFPEMKVALQSPQVLLSWLVKAGGIEQIAAEGEEPSWHTTIAGKSVVISESSDDRLTRLLAQETAYADIYLRVLELCVSPETRAQIESIFKGSMIIENLKVETSFFIDKLEVAGGIEWNGRWTITQAGMDCLRRGDGLIKHT